MPGAASEGLHTGRAFEREGHGAWVTDVAGDLEAIQVQGAGGVRAAALLGDEAEFGEDQGAAGLEVHPAVPLEDAAEKGLGLVEPALTACPETQPDLGVDLAGLEALLDGARQALLVEVAGLGVLTGQQRDPAEAGEPEGRLRPDAQVLGDAKSVAVQPRGLLVVAGDLGREGERMDGLQ